jgi:hypothetical protein
MRRKGAGGRTEQVQRKKYAIFGNRTLVSALERQHAATAPRSRSKTRQNEIFPTAGATQKTLQSPGFGPGSLAWEAKILTTVLGLQELTESGAICRTISPS